MSSRRASVSPASGPSTNKAVASALDPAQVRATTLAERCGPVTGMPVTGPHLSASVVARTCAGSSALATALFVLGPEAGETLARREDIAALFLLEKAGRSVGRESPAFARLPMSLVQTR